MLTLFIFWAIFLLFLFPSLLLLWKTSGGKQKFLAILLIYFFGNVIYAVIISDQVSDDFFRWKSTPVWFIVNLPVEVFFATLVSLAFKLNDLKGSTTERKKLFYFVTLFLAAYILAIVFTAIFDFVPKAEWLWRLGTTAAFALLIFSGVLMVREILLAFRVKIVASVVIALVLIVPVYSFEIFILGTSIIAGSENFYHRELQMQTASPDKVHSFYFYRFGSPESGVVEVYQATGNSVTMQNIFYGGSYQAVNLKSINNDSLVFEFDENYHSGGFLGIFGGTNGTWTRHACYEISSQKIFIDGKEKEINN